MKSGRRSMILSAAFWCSQSTLLGLAGCSQTASSPSAATPEVRLEIVDYAGIERCVAERRGRVVVMDCWSTSCEPCLREFPGLVELAKQYPQDVSCISLSFDYEGLGKPEDQKPKVRAFLEKQHATFANLLSSEPSDDLYARFKLAAIPAVFVYGRDGKLAKRFDADSEGRPFTYRDVGAKVAELVKQGNANPH